MQLESLKFSPRDDNRLVSILQICLANKYIPFLSLEYPESFVYPSVHIFLPDHFLHQHLVVSQTILFSAWLTLVL